MPIERFRLGGNLPEPSPELAARQHAMSDADIESNALNDPENPPMSEDELRRGVVGRDLRSLRKRLGLSQTAFAARFHIKPARLRDWEQGRYLPDSVALAYLKVIASDARTVEAALAE
jgi:putative transcriptional regulator